VSDNRLSRREFLDTCALGGAGLGLLPIAGGSRLSETIAGLPFGPVGNVARHPARYWHIKEGKETKCELCPRGCEIQPGERGTCGVRENIDGKYVSMVYGKPCEIRPDAMEKGPYFHFLPGTKTLALGTAGCNLDCKYCQSASFAKARPETTDNKNLSPGGLVNQLLKLGYKSVTFTFSEPLVAIEYVLDVAKLARPRGIRVLFKTAAYANSVPFEDICNNVDAINIDLKGFTEKFYKDMTGGELGPVLNNIRRVRRHPNVWLELTNLVVPGYNDNDREFAAMCQWIVTNCGADTPLHVSKFFPQYKLRKVPPTPNDTLKRLRRLAYNSGLHYVYLGNMPGDPAESSYCPKCGAKIINRINYEAQFVEFDRQKGICTKCGLRIPGVWA
jgi:pyruvate formate lyase activating enzyme